MLYQNYTVKDLSNLPADYILNEMDFVKKMNRRLKDKLYWRYDADPDSRGEMYLIYDDVLRGWAFLSDARDVLSKRGEYAPGVTEQRLIDRRAKLSDLRAVEYDFLSTAGMERALIDLESRGASASSTFDKTSGETVVRKDVAELFLRNLSELHLEEWKRRYDLLGEAYLTDVPTWALILTLKNGTKVRFAGRGDYPYNFFKLKDSVHRLMNEIVSQ